MTPRDLLVTALMALMALTPLAALTVITYRSRRAGWWLVAPWLLLGLGWLVILQLFHSFGLTAGGQLGAAVIASGFLAGWLAMSIFLIALTLAGPRLPPPGVVLKK